MRPLRRACWFNPLFAWSMYVRCKYVDVNVVCTASRSAISNSVVRGRSDGTENGSRRFRAGGANRFKLLSHRFYYCQSFEQFFFSAGRTLRMDQFMYATLPSHRNYIAYQTQRYEVTNFYIHQTRWTKHIQRRMRKMALLWTHR